MWQTLISFLKDKQYRNLLLTTLMFVAAGSVVYRYLEGWTWIDSIYFSVVALATVGFGDLSPQTDAGKIFTIFYIVFGVGLVLTFIDTLYRHYITRNGRGDDGDVTSKR